ncbi:MAG: serine/threonine protein kinase [Bacteroidales bacterium]|nr:serine/threonine protein kinase [Bacteroidales bacterium]
MGTESASQALRPGTVISSEHYDYKIVKVLGAGSFGITYLATADVQVGNVSVTVKFAVKEHFMSMSCYRGDDGAEVLCTPASKEDVELSRNDFLIEARRLQTLCQKSRGIVHVNETFEANNTAYYVMEFLNGGSPGQMPEGDAINIICQVAQAVDTIHGEKLLHLDIKPDNIVMKTNDSGEVYPVLIDFGVAKHFGKDNKPTSHLQAKGASAGYAPQEQYDEGGITEFSPKYDIYALGAVLLFLLTGKNPPSAFKISPNQAELAAMIPASVTASTRAAILGAMKPSAFERTESIADFVAQLTGSAQLPTNLPTGAASGAVAAAAAGGATEVLTAGRKPSAKSGKFAKSSKVTTSAPKKGLVTGRPGSGGFNGDPQKKSNSKLIMAIIGAVVIVGALVGCFFLIPGLLDRSEKPQEEVIVAEVTPDGADKASIMAEDEDMETPAAPAPNEEAAPAKATPAPNVEASPAAAPAKPATAASTSKPATTTATAPATTTTSAPAATPAAPKPLTNAEIFAQARKEGDFKTINRLAKEGYAPAYLPVAQRYYANGSMSAARSYAQKSIDAQVNVSEAKALIAKIDAASSQQSVTIQ